MKIVKKFKIIVVTDTRIKYKCNQWHGVEWSEEIDKVEIDSLFQRTLDEICKICSSIEPSIVIALNRLCQFKHENI